MAVLRKTHANHVVRTRRKFVLLESLDSQTIIFCNSETTSFRNIGIQYLSSFVFHLLQTFLCFLDEFNSFLSSAATTPNEFIINDGFKIHLDNHSDYATSPFLSLSSVIV